MASGRSGMAVVLALCVGFVAACTMAACTATTNGEPAPAAAGSTPLTWPSGSSGGLTSLVEPSAGEITSQSSSAAGPSTGARSTQTEPSDLPYVTVLTDVTDLPNQPGFADLPDVGLPGVNDAACESDRRHVVLLHGTFSNVARDFRAMAADLLDRGWCVYGINYGSGGVGPVTTSAADVAAFVVDLAARSPSGQVDLVGFSQGGLVARTALRQQGLAPLVHTLVLIAPTFHGSTSGLLTALPDGACPACADQAAGSALLVSLDAGGDLDGAVQYAVVSSADDAVVTPVDAQVPVGPPDRVRALLVQDQCPGGVVDHVALVKDPGVIAWTAAALASGGTPEPSALSCE